MKFTTPVSMPCTEAQYNELKPLLEAMGYEDCTWQYDAYIGCIKPLAIASTVINLTTYNKDLFLALAAMTDEPNGIAGEWWKYEDFDTRHFTPNKIYKAIRPINMGAAFSDDMNVANGFTRGNHSYFTKASIAEIFAHFGVRYSKEQSEPIQPEMPQPTPLIPQGCTFREWQRTFLAGCFAQGILSREDDFDNAILVQNVDLLISELDKTK